VKLLAYPLLTDENIHTDVVSWLRQGGRDVQTVFDHALNGGPDARILQHAHAEGRVVLTHDSDFGLIAIRGGEPFTGILYLRPGHFMASFTIETLRAVELSPIDIVPPFIAVAERRENETRVRVRRHLV
jgi:predicted nuclease of predicted toxin-antitoxin system